jgi:ABC-type oligopeptide transport system substrate-binding subunit
MSVSSRPLALALIAGALALALAGCTEVEEFESTNEPTSVQPVKGQDDIQQVTFTADAARRVDLRTSTVRATARLTSIPYAALIYNEDGDTYTYVNRKPLVFVRVLIDVDHIADGRVVLKHGPPLGTRVVTTGAAEVYSAEFGVEE